MSEHDIQALINEKEELEQTMKKLEEGAVQVIMEKEKIILELQESLMKLQDNNQLEEMKEQMEQNFHYQVQQRDDEIQQLKDTLQQLHSKMEQDSFQFEQTLMRVQADITDELLDRLNNQMNQAKQIESELHEKIHLSDERVKYLEHHIHNQESLTLQYRESHLQELHQYENRNFELQRKVQGALSTILKQEKMVEDAFKQLAQIRTERNNDILKVTKVRDEVLRSNIKLEKDCRRQQEQLQHIHKEHEQLEKDLKQLKDKSWIESKIAHEKIHELDKKHQQTISQLHHEISRLKEEQFESKRRDSVGNSLGNSQVREDNVDSNHSEDRLQGQGNMLAEFQNADFSAHVQANMFTIDHQEVKEQEQDSDKRIVILPQELEHPLMPSHQMQQDKEAFFLSQKKQIIEQSPILVRTINESENIREENESLRDLIISLKQENEDLAQQTETHVKTIELLQSEMRNSFRASGHETCFTKERALVQELETYKVHSFKLETHFITAKQQWAEEQNYIKEELKYAESSLLEAKTLLAQTTIEKEYFQSMLRSMQNQIKKQKTKKIETKVTQIKETDYSTEQEHLELANRAIQKQLDMKNNKVQEENKQKKRGSILSYFYN